MWTVVALLALSQVEPRQLAPVDSIAHAAADLIRLPFDAGKHTRYLSLYNVPAKDRAKATQILSGHCNGLSREPDLTPLAIVPNTEGALLRVDLTAYRWDAATWERLVDPYFTAVIETEVVNVVPWEGGLWEGKHYAAGSFTYKKRTPVRT